MRLTPLLFTICFLVYFSFQGYSQSEWRTWNSAGLNLSFSKKLDLRFSHMRSYSITNNFENIFNQTTASLEFDATKRVSVLAAVMNTGIPASAKNTQRYYTRLAYKLPVANVLTWSNAVQAEIHSANETRFRNRFIYITRISNKKRFDFLNLNLSAAYWFFYNTGGNEISYYDKTGKLVAKNSPDGFHRGRLFLAASSKITKDLSVSLLYMHQQEFNLPGNEFRNMNVVNPNTGRTARAFDNYNVVGLSLTYDVDLYQKKNSSKNKSNTKKSNHGKEN